jgi:predicted permease
MGSRSITSFACSQFLCLVVAVAAKLAKRLSISWAAKVFALGSAASSAAQGASIARRCKCDPDAVCATRKRIDCHEFVTNTGLGCLFW